VVFALAIEPGLGPYFLQRLANPGSPF
jgi:hypothetical protein